MGDDWGLVVVTTEKSGLGYPEVEATGTGRRRIRPWSAKMWVFDRPSIYRSPVYLRFYLQMNCRNNTELMHSARKIRYYEILVS